MKLNERHAKSNVETFVKKKTFVVVVIGVPLGYDNPCLGINREAMYVDDTLP